VNYKDIEVIRGPNIKPFPKNKSLEDITGGKVLIKVGDDVTTDAIMPSNAKLLPYRSNIPYLSEFCFSLIDKDFPQRAKENGGGVILAGKNYGQGSSREHAALAPLYLGVKAVIAKSFARIHKGNLINNGIIPLTFVNEEDYEGIDLMDEIIIYDPLSQLKNDIVTVENKTKNKTFKTRPELSERAVEILKAGGLLNFMAGVAK